MIMRCSQIGQFGKMSLLLPPHLTQSAQLSLVSLHGICSIQCNSYYLLCLVGPTYIIYSKENSDAVLEVSGFLRNCGLACDIDQYHTHENITQWGVWIENKIKEVAKNKGFVLLICSSKMYQQLSDPNSSRIEMKAGHIVTPTLNNLITDPATTNCIIPVCLEEVNKEIVPISLHGRTIYSLSFSALMKVNPNADLRSILDRPELESLRSLVYRLRGELEINRPPISKVYSCHHS